MIKSIKEDTAHDPTYKTKITRRFFATLVEKGKGYLRRRRVYRVSVGGYGIPQISVPLQDEARVSVPAWAGVYPGRTGVRHLPKYSVNNDLGRASKIRWRDLSYDCRLLYAVFLAP
jgi:hypothetical protein